jgi:NADH dehydrogenase/putative oxidoreductase
MVHIGEWLPRLVSAYSQLVRVAHRAIWPLAELAARLWLAQRLFGLGMVQLMDSDGSAPTMGATISVASAICVATGLLTRPAALLMCAWVILGQIAPPSLDERLYWIALLSWYFVAGPGPISIDRLLQRGLTDSALPGAARAAAAGEWLARSVGPLYRLTLRIWLSATILAAIKDGAPAAMMAALMSSSVLDSIVPIATAPLFPQTVGLMAAAALMLGLLTRPVALALLVFGGSIAAMHMMHPHATEHSYWLIPLALLTLQGAGALSLDRLILAALDLRFPQLAGKQSFALTEVPRVVIVGAGFAGISCAAGLARARVAVTIIDRANYHLFQPLLYQVATAGISPGDIATPIRTLFRNFFNISVLLGEVTGIDRDTQCVMMGDRAVPYDYLVLATGASHSYFGQDQWQAHAPGLKNIEDATQIRQRVLTAFERAEATENDQERGSLLTFLIVGGGPTGVELAGAIAELARFGMDKDFRRFDPASARVLLVQSASRVLPTFPEVLSSRAQKALERLGVEVLTNSRVEEIDAHGVMIGGERILSSTVLWAAGVVASPAARWLNVEADSAGRTKVGSDLTVSQWSNVFVVGDTAAAMAWNGQPVPGLAPAAKQAGRYAANVIRSRVEGRRLVGPFVYRHRGSLATIGRKAAVAHFGRITLSGAPAWWLWGLVHIGFMVGVRNRFATLLNWFWAYLTWGGGIRLITHDPRSTRG